MVHALEAMTAQPRFDPADTPVEATVSRGGRTLAMTFADGATALVAAATMRANCRCAWCTRARVDGRFPSAFEAAAIVALEPVGGYAAHVVFADGHDRGIFPWTFLRTLADDDGAAAAA